MRNDDAPRDAPDFSRLLRFRRRHSGREALLLCNGPTLRDVDFARVDRKRLTVFGLNKIYLGFEMMGWEPDYLVAVNKKVLRQSRDVYRRLRMPKFISSRLPLAQLPPDPLTFHMRTTHLPEHAIRFSTDIVDYVREGWTVTHAALQVIYYMGFRKVFIVGMDHHFSQHIPGMENKPQVLHGADSDHFHPDYFGGGQTWDLPDLRNSEISYQAARATFEADGRQILDCTEKGACTVFEKAPVERIYTQAVR